MFNIAEKIKTLREEKGLSAAQLADKSDLSPAFISKLESGEYSNLTLTTSKSLADGLGLTLKTFLEAIGFMDKEYRERPGFEMVASALRSNGYGPEAIRKIEEYAELLKKASNRKS